MVDEGMVGVDVEAPIMRPDIDGVATLVFGPNEQAELSAARGRNKTRLFYTLWTLKEALIKAIGTGFAMDTSQFEIPSVMRQGALRCRYRLPQMADICWRLENCGNDHLAAAVAYECGAKSDG
ncbi:MAG: 4'-phosphopantetheinyl transferase superfamily protein [Bacteroidota bacterium]|nr:4'-phosphopantetheinyl transferase superfamily protein [Bacteroidota bacterium]MDE2955796.1 4'-phosphopantetheinyl transferase superfamily protein [Bacteroidota bacterium]